MTKAEQAYQKWRNSPEGLETVEAIQIGVVEQALALCFSAARLSVLTEQLGEPFTRAQAAGSGGIDD